MAKILLPEDEIHLQEIEKDIRNKFRWEWLDKQVPTSVKVGAINTKNITNNLAAFIKKVELPDNDAQQNKTDPVPNTEKRKNEVENEHIKKVKLSIFDINYCVAERQGERNDMQDAHVVCEDFKSHVSDLDLSVCRLSLYGLFDGHGGARASQFCSETLHLKVAKHFPKDAGPNFGRDLKTCLIDSFTETDKEFLHKAKQAKPSWKDGSTAIICLIIDNTLYVANVGDSKAILCRQAKTSGALHPIVLSTDHSPTLYEERLRIQKNGGTVRDGRVMGILEVSRSIGDGQYKSFGISCIPVVKKCSLTSNDRFVIMACDGLWKVFSPQEVATKLENLLNDITKNNLELSEIKSRCEKACTDLANEAVRNGCEDNVTILLLHIS
ncbi:Integrin-linked kinase-associated serine/threonine phosphatase 2C [Nymphon striatum]|nr:Integrin-linked kinase-associated serine/threonine phosphatase 2C [Nymphon striatum]